jgi:hypothetical protein
VKTIISVSNSPQQFKQKIGKLRKKAVFEPENSPQNRGFSYSSKKIENWAKKGYSIQELKAAKVRKWWRLR